MEYYSAIKRNEFESVLMKWINLEPIIQSEITQKEKNKYINIWTGSLAYCYSWGRKELDTTERLI